MRKSQILIVLSALAFGWNALGGLSQPMDWQQLERELASRSQNVQAIRTNVPKYSRHNFSKFRPVTRDGEIDYAAVEKALSSKTTIEELFDEDFERRMRAQYAGLVAPHDSAVNNPYRPARWYEIERSIQARKDLAKWTAREALNEQVRDFFRKGDKSSAPMQVWSTVREVTGNGEEERPVAAVDTVNADGSITPAAEASIPTRLKAKMNLLRTQGQLLFTNPFATTTVDVKAGSGENFVVNLNRDFRSLQMNSNVRYGVDDSLLVFNVNKRITDQVSLDLNSERYTGGKRGAGGEKSRDTARVTYSLSF